MSGDTFGMLQAIFFDAAGTLFWLPAGVGYHYALVGRRFGVALDAAVLDRAFGAVWKEMPPRPSTGLPRVGDDKGWWRELVFRVLARVVPEGSGLNADDFFEAAYAHFAEPGVWELFPEVREVLESLRGRYRLGVISNFDCRLHTILRDLGIAEFFSDVFISSELGADKPDPLIFRLALERFGAAPNESLHVGDDPVRDWKAAEEAGLRVFKLQRPANSLRDLLGLL